MSPVVAESLTASTPRRWRIASWRVASWLRARWWGLVVALFTDGLSTVRDDGACTPLASRPRLPAGPLVVVANHRSHADSAALLATLGRDRPVLFVAAADYWFTSTVRRWAASLLVGVWPVRRDGSGWRDLAAAAVAVRAGVVVVVYPEGSRSRDARLSEFRTGPFRLAALAGARVLPVAVAGTDRVFPVHGRISRAPIEVRWGEPITVEDPSDAAREAHRQVAERLERPAVVRPGRTWTRARALASSRWGLALLFVWALGEGISWPLVAELPLALLVVTATARAPLLIAASAAGSVCGILLTWWLVSHGVHPPAPLTTARMHETAAAQIAADPTVAFRAQQANGIPVKVYAAAAGDQGLPVRELVASVWPRVLRITVVGTAVGVAGLALRRFLQPALGVVQSAVLIVFPFVLWRVIEQWR